MVKKRNQIFVLIIPRFEDIYNSFYAEEIIRGVTLAASRINVDILIHMTDRRDHAHWLDALNLNNQSIDGIIFADIDNDLNVVKKVIRQKIPYIVLNNILREPINCVAVDNYRATTGLIDHLVKLGHTRIATIFGDLSTQAGVLRLEAYKKALKTHQVPLSKHYVLRGDFSRTLARQAAQKLLKLPKRPTAIFAASDIMALEVIDVAKALNLKVPEDLSVIGFDGNPITVYSPVKLTTVAQPLMEMARVGTEKLNQIRRGRIGLPVKVMLPMRMVRGKSVKAVKKEEGS